MPATIRIRKEEYIVETPVKLLDALHGLDLSPQSYLAVRGGEILTEDLVIQNDDQIQLIAVISGG
jgi:sulfur carrier protein ThiS